MWYASDVGWTLSERQVKTFSRNTLAAVVAQLRFHPILRIAEHYVDFQEHLRSRFPRYEAVEAQTVNFNLGSAVPSAAVVRTEKVHRFLAAEEPTAVALSTASVSIDYEAHQERATLIKDFSSVLDVLRGYGPVPVRLGLRYVNIIEAKTLSEHFGCEIAWSELLTPSFASVPGGLASVDSSTSYLAEITAPKDRGKMTVKYGLLVQHDTKEQHFRLDTDRFVEGVIGMAEITDLLTQFSDDIFQVFMMAAGPKLVEWMEATR